MTSDSARLLDSLRLRLARLNPAQVKLLRALAFLAAIAVPLCASAQAAVEKTAASSAIETRARYALVFGNSDYPNGSIDAARKNARALSKSLRALGFQVDLAENATSAAMRQSLVTLSERAKTGGLVLVYFSGHVIRSRNAQLLLPVDADIDIDGRSVRNALAVETLFETLQRPQDSAANIVIVDSAPYPVTRKFRGLKIETALLKTPANFLYADSNERFPVTTSGSGLSLYTERLIEAVDTPGQPVEAIFQALNATISAMTNGAHIPWHTSTLSRDVFLAEPTRARVPETARGDTGGGIRGIRLSEKEAPKSPAADKSMPGSKTAQATKSATEFESTLWGMIQNSKDPADFEAYLEVFPNGRFQKQARRRIAVLRVPKALKPPARKKPALKKPALKIESMRAEFEFAYAGNIRKRPDKASSILDKALKGDRITVTGRVVGSNWLRVSTQQGAVAFVSSSILRKPKAVSPQEKPKRDRPASTLPKLKPRVAVTPPRISSGGSGAPIGKVFRDCPGCPEMVQIPAGSFRMGSNSGDQSERPVRTIRIPKRFAVSKYEVTIGQWGACVDAGGCAYKPRIKNAPKESPVHKLSWQDAQSYLKWLKKVTGKPYRLLSEAEWEYAARGGSDRKFWWGQTMKAGFANCKSCGGEWSYKFPAAVEKFAANPFGLHGMSGGVWEWVQDCWQPNHSSSPTDGSAATRGDCSGRVLRGGSWRNDAGYAHASSRLRYDFNVRYSTNGFRVARDLQ